MSLSNWNRTRWTDTICPDCGRLLTSDDRREGDPGPRSLRIHRRPWRVAYKYGCTLCTAMQWEFNIPQDWIAGPDLILGRRLQNADRIEKRTSLELLWINKRKDNVIEVEEDLSEREVVYATHSPENDDFSYLRQLKFSVLAENGDTAGGTIAGRLAELEVDSDRSLRTIKRWIWHCDSQHSSCPGRKKGKSPKRLIEVSSMYSEGAVKLCTTSNDQERYIALSYCWGNSTPITTTSSNVESFSERIPLRSLPQTIQDAVSVTYRLGFNFLWVDALCIIQDDSPEKAEEMADMANIYSHAAVTIIAAVAHDSNQGFLHKRQEIQVENLFNLPISLGHGKVGTVGLCRDEEQIYKHSAEPISKRAWCLQESILSPRCLIFATQQVFWKCTKAFWKDGGFTDWSTFKENSGCWTNLGLAYTNRGLASFGGGDFVSVENALPPSRSELTRRWFKVAEAYSSRLLSDPNDKLPALSSITSMYRDILKDDYLAGVWRSSLLAGLLWVSSGQEETRPARICPTWSWLSIDSSVSFTYFMRPAAEWQSFAKIRSCTVTPLFSFAPYGQLKEGSLLEISGPAFEMILGYDSQSTGRLTLSGPEASAQVPTSFFPDVKIHDCAGSRVECLIMFCTTWQNWTAAGLVLAPSDLEKGLYKRIGYFEAGPGSRQSWTETERKTLQESRWIFDNPRKIFTVI